MTAFFISTIKIKNAEKFQEYGSKVGATAGPFGGQLAMRGKAEKTLVGTSDHQLVTIVNFPDMDALNGWYESAEYQALTSIREEAADMTVVAYEASN